MGYLNWNSYCEQDGSAVKHASTTASHHANESDATARCVGENELAQKENRLFQQDNEHVRDGYHVQDDGKDLISLLDIYFSHVAGCLPGTFSHFCSIVTLSAAVGVREFAAVGLRIFVTRACSFYSGLMLLPTVLCVFIVGLTLKASCFLFFTYDIAKCIQSGPHEGR